jgi:hypothetical protein
VIDSMYYTLVVSKVLLVRCKMSSDDGKEYSDDSEEEEMLKRQQERLTKIFGQAFKYFMDSMEGKQSQVVILPELRNGYPPLPDAQRLQIGQLVNHLKVLIGVSYRGGMGVVTDIAQNDDNEYYITIGVRKPSLTMTSWDEAETTYRPLHLWEFFKEPRLTTALFARYQDKLQYGDHVQNPPPLCDCDAINYVLFGRGWPDERVRTIISEVLDDVNYDDNPCKFNRMVSKIYDKFHRFYPTWRLTVGVNGIKLLDPKITVGESLFVRVSRMVRFATDWVVMKNLQVDIRRERANFAFRSGTHPRLGEGTALYKAMGDKNNDMFNLIGDLANLTLPKDAARRKQAEQKKKLTRRMSALEAAAEPEAKRAAPASSFVRRDPENVVRWEPRGDGGRALVSRAVMANGDFMSEGVEVVHPRLAGFPRHLQAQIDQQARLRNSGVDLYAASREE